MPKALAVVHRTPNLINTLRTIKDLFQRVLITVNHEDASQFSDAVRSEGLSASLIPIASGLGSGHALLQSLCQTSISDPFILCWGDAYFFSGDLIRELLQKDTNSQLLIPLQQLANPYVSIIVDNELVAHSVDFSKYGERHEVGFKDLGVFKMRTSIVDILQHFHNANWKKSKYITNSHEFEFLYIVHFLHNVGLPAQCYLTEYPNSVRGFNTLEELEKLNLLVGNRGT